MGDAPACLSCLPGLPCRDSSDLPDTPGLPGFPASPAPAEEAEGDLDGPAALGDGRDSAVGLGRPGPEMEEFPESAVGRPVDAEGVRETVGEPEGAPDAVGPPGSWKQYAVPAAP